MKIYTLLLALFLLINTGLAYAADTTTQEGFDKKYKLTYLDGCNESCKGVVKQRKVGKEQAKQLIHQCQLACQCNKDHLELFMSEADLLELVRSYNTKKQDFANLDLKRKMNGLTDFCLAKQSEDVNNTNNEVNPGNNNLELDSGN